MKQLPRGRGYGKLKLKVVFKFFIFPQHTKSDICVMFVFMSPVMFLSDVVPLKNKSLIILGESFIQF